MKAFSGAPSQAQHLERDTLATPSPFERVAIHKYPQDVQQYDTFKYDTQQRKLTSCIVVYQVDTDAGKAAYERRREQIRNAQRSHRHRKQMHLTTMRQSLDQLAKETSSLKRELENSRSENVLLKEKLCHIILPPAGMMHNAPPSPPSSSVSMIGADSPKSLTPTSAISTQSGSEFDVQFKQFSSNSLSTRHTPYSCSALHASPTVQAQGAHLHTIPTTYISHNSACLLHQGVQKPNSYFDVESEVGPVATWTPISDRLQFPQLTGLADQDSMAMMPHAWYYESLEYGMCGDASDGGLYDHFQDGSIGSSLYG